MGRSTRAAIKGAAGVLIGLAGQDAAGEAYRPPVRELEAYQAEPMPPGFGVQHSDADGPVFVDGRGRTLYVWPVTRQQVGEAGEQKGAPKCDDTRETRSAGFLSPYPAGLILPDLDTRPTCLQAWPAVFAGSDAKAVGKWTIVSRPDGRQQWAYDGHALYTSVLDTRPGQVNGATGRDYSGETPALRRPVGPSPLLPPDFRVWTVALGRLLTTQAGRSIYVWDGDGPRKSNCDFRCVEDWSPMPAPQTAQPRGEWGIIERTPGVRQWTYRERPLYTRVADKRPRSQEGSDVAGWHNVYTQKLPDPPRGITVQDSRVGQVLADARGMTLYTYLCGEDTLAQLACDHPSTTQAYRLAVCGNGDAAVCNRTFPYVPAPVGARVNSLIWGTAWIDPSTGHHAKPRQAGAMHVWTFRDRPVYTHGGDRKPGDANGDAWGEVMGFRNGYKAFWIRDDFWTNAD